MDKLTWDEVVESSQTTPSTRELPDHISMKGMLGVDIHPDKDAPAEIFHASSSIERAVKQAYANLSVTAEESQRKRIEGYSDIYWGQIYANDSTGVVMKIGISASSARGGLIKQPTVFAVFPLGDYFEQTNEALKEIWKHIAGCEMLLIPNKDCGVPEEKFGNQSILLYQGGKPVAIGEYAIQDSGLDIEVKDPILGRDGVLI